MKPQIQTLKADITADLRAIEEIYISLNRYPDSPSSEEQLIVTAYYLHNLYSAFESVFQHIAEAFENQVDDRSGWHAELLHRMTLDIEGIRPRLLSPEAYDSLDELRRFRHLFRSAYRVHLDSERLLLVRKKAKLLELLYHTDISQFQSFLDTLQQS